MANKGRVLYLLRYLQQCSDEDHPVTTVEIRKELDDKGCPATVETVRDDILDPKKNGGAILFGQLAPFYTRLKNELMDHIV